MIEDARYLFSALIQALPTVISLSLIAIFALKPERGFFRKCIWRIGVLISLFFFAILGDMYVLYDLDNLIKNNSWPLFVFLIISTIAIVALIVFLLWYIYLVNKPFENNEKPSEQCPIKILKCRYAKGEITKKQFTQMKKDLS